MTRLIVEISDELMNRLDSQAKGEPKALATLVRRALRDYLEAFGGTIADMGQ